MAKFQGPPGLASPNAWISRSLPGSSHIFTTDNPKAQGPGPESWLHKLKTRPSAKHRTEQCARHAFIPLLPAEHQWRKQVLPNPEKVNYPDANCQENDGSILGNNLLLRTLANPLGSALKHALSSVIVGSAHLGP